jgi:predicted nucleic acid-binding Zn ribbon protein
MTDQNEKTYEMLWDCDYCGTKKLLGKTHRHCPECGAVQDAERRYFPTDDEKVAAEDHEFVGADRHCPMCNAPNSARAKFCTECGGPVAEGVEVRGVGGGPSQASEARRPKPKSNKKGLVVLGILGLVAAAVAVLVFWKKEVALTVTGHTWQREIAIEQFAALNEDEWCDQMPQAAYNVSRSREVRSHRDIPDGEECTTRRVDNKDGTFTEKQECRTKYRKEPVYDDKCRFTVNRWHEVRTVHTAGKSLSETPIWPAVTLPPRPAEVLGAERPGRRVETYTIHFASKKGGSHTCELPEAQWRSIGANTKWKGESGALTDVLDCGSLIPAR